MARGSERNTSARAAAARLAGGLAHIAGDAEHRLDPLFDPMVAGEPHRRSGHLGRGRTYKVINYAAGGGDGRRGGPRLERRPFARDPLARRGLRPFRQQGERFPPQDGCNSGSRCHLGQCLGVRRATEAKARVQHATSDGGVECLEPQCEFRQLRERLRHAQVVNRPDRLGDDPRLGVGKEIRELRRGKSALGKQDREPHRGIRVTAQGKDLRAPSRRRQPLERHYARMPEMHILVAIALHHAAKVGERSIWRAAQRQRREILHARRCIAEQCCEPAGCAGDRRVAELSRQLRAYFRHRIGEQGQRRFQAASGATVNLPEALQRMHPGPQITGLQRDAEQSGGGASVRGKRELRLKPHAIVGVTEAFHQH